MVHHIVVWRFFDQADGRDKNQNLTIARDMLLAMENQIPGLLSIHSGTNITHDNSAWDLGLYCTFQFLEDLRVYQNHPVHAEVKKFMAKVRKDRAMVDWEI